MAKRSIHKFLPAHEAFPLGKSQRELFPNPLDVFGTADTNDSNGGKRPLKKRKRKKKGETRRLVRRTVMIKEDQSDFFPRHQYKFRQLEGVIVA